MVQIYGPLLAFFVAGVVQGATGFGSGLVSVALLGLIGVGIKSSSVILVFPTTCLSLWVLAGLWKHLELRRMLPLLISAVLVIPLGVLFLREARPHTLLFVLSLVLFASVGQRLIPTLKAKRWHPVWLGVPCGVLSGLLGGAFNTGGPPVVAFASTQQFDRYRYVACLQLAFTAYGVGRFLCLVGYGMFTRELFALSLSGVMFAIFGAYLGLRVLSRISDKLLGRIVAVALLALAVRYMHLAMS